MMATAPLAASVIAVSLPAGALAGATSGAIGPAPSIDHPTPSASFKAAMASVILAPATCAPPKDTLPPVVPEEMTATIQKSSSIRTIAAHPTAIAPAMVSTIDGGAISRPAAKPEGTGDKDDPAADTTDDRPFTVPLPPLTLVPLQPVRPAATTLVTATQRPTPAAKDLLEARLGDKEAVFGVTDRTPLTPPRATIAVVDDAVGAASAVPRIAPTALIPFASSSGAHRPVVERQTMPSVQADVTSPPVAASIAVSAALKPDLREPSGTAATVATIAGAAMKPVAEAYPEAKKPVLAVVTRAGPDMLAVDTPALGAVSAALTRPPAHDATLNLHFTVERTATAALITSGMADLARTLDAAGVSFDGISVGLGGGHDAAGSGAAGSSFEPRDDVPRSPEVPIAGARLPIRPAAPAARSSDRYA